MGYNQQLMSVHRSKCLSGSVITIILLLLIQTTLIQTKPNRPLLRGVTFRNWPYADRINDRYEGFVVDLMNLIAQKVGFEYRLYFSPDGKYGTEMVNGNINGMIGEVFRNRADFAIADLTVTEPRKRYVDFTEAFLENQLAAIIRRDDAVGLRTLEDLVTLNEINHRPDLPPTERRRDLLTYGTYRNGATYYHLSKNRDPIAKKIYEWMVRNPDALVKSAKEGFDRVNAGRYAFIVESTFAEYLTGIYCNLTMLYDTRSLYPRKFAIALPKGSPFIHEFNKAIRELKANGIIQRLHHKYWINRCTHMNKNNNDDPLDEPSIQERPSTETPSIVPVTNSTRNNEDQLVQNLSDSNKNNAATNAIKFEWASHNHHQHHYHQQHPPSASMPPEPPSIDHRNRNNPIHHRLNPHHHYNRNNNKLNPDYLDSDTDLYYKDAARRRTNGSNASLSSCWLLLSILIMSMFFNW